MARFDFMFHEDGTAYTAHSETLEQDQAEEHAAGGNIPIAAHVTFEASERQEPAINAIRSIHILDLENGAMNGSTLEQLLSEVFKAGVNYGRSS